MLAADGEVFQAVPGGQGIAAGEAVKQDAELNESGDGDDEEYADDEFDEVTR